MEVTNVLAAYGEVQRSEDGQAILRVPRAQAAAVTARVLADLPVANLSIEDPPIEDDIEQVFSGNALAEAHTEAAR